MQKKLETFTSRQQALAVAHKMTVLAHKADAEDAGKMIYVIEQDVTDPLTGETLSTHYDLVGANVRPRRGTVIYDGVEEWDHQTALEITLELDATSEEEAK